MVKFGEGGHFWISLSSISICRLIIRQCIQTRGKQWNKLFNWRGPVGQLLLIWFVYLIATSLIINVSSCSLFNGYHPFNYFAQYTGMLLFCWILRYHRISLFWGMWFLLCTFLTIWTSGSGCHLLTKQSHLTGFFFGPGSIIIILLYCSLCNRFSKQLLPFSSKGMLSMQTQRTIMITQISYSFRRSWGE